MSDDTNKQIHDRFKEIFPSPQVAATVTRLVTSKRPLTWGRKSNSAYYKQSYALEIKKDIDHQLETKEDIIYSYRIWCEGPHAVSTTTLYLRVNMSIRYLIDKLDVDGKYQAWWDGCSCIQERGMGIRISVTTNRRGAPMQGTFVQPKEADPLWRRQFDEWIEGDDTEPFVRERLALSDEEVRQLEQELSELVNIQADISHTKIAAIKMS